MEEWTLLGHTLTGRPPPLLTLLLLHPRRGVTRSDAVGWLWPGESGPDVQNRLRVALARLRRRVEVSEVEGHLVLPHPPPTDLGRLQSELEALSVEPDPDLERVRLTALLPELEQPLLPELQHSWIEEAQSNWALQVTDALTRLALAAEQAAEWGLAQRASSAGLRHLPFDEDLWAIWLRASGHLGQSKAALTALRRARSTRLGEGDDFSADLLVLAADLEALQRPEADDQLDPGEIELLSRTLQVAMRAEPELLWQVLTSRSFRLEVIRSPGRALPLLEVALAMDPPKGVIRERIEVRILTALSLLGERDRVIKLGQAFLAQPVDPTRRRIALLNIAFPLYERGRADEAFAALDEAIHLGETHGVPSDAWEARGQRAGLRLRNGELDLASDELRQVCEFFRQPHHTAARRDVLILRLNELATRVHLGQSDVAPELEDLLQIGRRERQPEVEATARLHLGVVLARLGRAEEAGDHLAQGLRWSFRCGAPVAITGLQSACLALHALGAPSTNRAAEIWWSHVRREDRVPSGIEWAIHERLARPAAGPAESLVDAVREVVRLVKESTAPAD